MSARPGPASVSGKPVSSVSSATTCASATDASCGRCETMPTAQSCVSASHQTGSAPMRLQQRRKFLDAQIRIALGRNQTHNACREKDLHPACSIPEFSLPAMGCPPKKSRAAAKIFLRLLAYRGLRAARIGDECSVRWLPPRSLAERQWSPQSATRRTRGRHREQRRRYRSQLR